jgi:hypothetical protein
VARYRAIAINQNEFGGHFLLLIQGLDEVILTFMHC